MKKSDEELSYELKCSYFEIYKENLEDLLGISPNLKITDGEGVINITEVKVAS